MLGHCIRLSSLSVSTTFYSLRLRVGNVVASVSTRILARQRSVLWRTGRHCRGTVELLCTFSRVQSSSVVTSTIMLTSMRRASPICYCYGRSAWRSTWHRPLVSSVRAGNGSLRVTHDPCDPWPMGHRGRHPILAQLAFHRFIDYPALYLDIVYVHTPLSCYIIAHLSKLHTGTCSGVARPKFKRRQIPPFHTLPSLFHLPLPSSPPIFP